MISKIQGSNQESNLKAFEKNNSNFNHAKKIILANKGETGYMPAFDIDNDGIITLDEFNQYCSENGISEEEKLKLISLMTNSKVSEKLSKNDDKKENERIYARKGEEKYVEEMDENKNSIITYEEYIEYCKKRTNQETDKNESISLKFKEAIKAYSKKEQNQEIIIDKEI